VFGPHVGEVDGGAETSKKNDTVLVGEAPGPLFSGVTLRRKWNPKETGGSPAVLKTELSCFRLVSAKKSPHLETLKKSKGNLSLWTHRRTGERQKGYHKKAGVSRASSQKKRSSDARLLISLPFLVESEGSPAAYLLAGGGPLGRGEVFAGPRLIHFGGCKGRKRGPQAINVRRGSRSVH